MYYAINYISWFFTIVAIAMVDAKTAPSWLIIILLLATAYFQAVASSLVVAKHGELEERIKNLENGGKK